MRADDRPDGAVYDFGIGEAVVYLRGQRRRAVGVVAMCYEDCVSQIRIPAAFPIHSLTPPIFP